jgi:hypothetical protein
MVPVSIWIVFMDKGGQASLRRFSDKFHLHLSPACCCELGRAWILHRGALHLTSQSPSPGSPPPLLMTALVYLPCQCAKQMFMRCVFGGACARLRSRAVAAGGLTPDERPELGPFVFGEYLRKRMNASGVNSSLMAHVCYSTHSSITKHLLNSISSFKTVPRGATRLPGDPCRGPGLMAGAGGAAGPAPDVRHQPAGDVHMMFLRLNSHHIFCQIRESISACGSAV